MNQPESATKLPLTLLTLTLAHALIDAYAAMIQPLWPDLQRGLALGDGATQGVFVAWSLATSVSQLAFAYWGDRGHGRWWLWAGTGLGIVCVSSVGLASGVLGLGVLLVVGGLGIASFHPEAAAAAGACAPLDRSRAMSLFAVGGFLGQAIGPVFSGVVTTRHGIPALAWSAPFGLVMVVVLARAMRRDPVRGHEAVRAAREPVALAELLRGRWPGVGLMIAIGVLRVMPCVGVPLALSYLLKLRGGSNEQIGVAQAAFLGAIGLGSLGCAIFVRRAFERRALWLLPVPAVPLLAACPVVGYTGLIGCAAAIGLSLGAVGPILVGYGQHLLRDGQRVASSLTMGVTWGLGGLIVAAMMAGLNHVRRPDLAFPVFAVSTAASSLLCAWLPQPDTPARASVNRETSGRATSAATAPR